MVINYILLIILLFWLYSKINNIINNPEILETTISFIYTLDRSVIHNALLFRHVKLLFKSH